MSDLRVISWNIFEGRRPDDVVSELVTMIRRRRPDVVSLYEAKHLVGHLDKIPGYTVVQLRSVVMHPDHLPETANVALLVRDGIEIIERRTLRMTQTWAGPKHGWLHDPRVYRVVILRKDGVVWKVGGFHVPFGWRARRETFAAMREWFAHTIPGRATVAVGDMNSVTKTITAAVTKAADASVAGEGIDLALYRNCHLIRWVDLGHHGSDHPAVLFVFRK